MIHWEKIFVTNITRTNIHINKHHRKINRKNVSGPLKNWAKCVTRNFAEREIQTTAEHVMELGLSNSQERLMKMRCGRPADWQN